MSLRELLTMSDEPILDPNIPIESSELTEVKFYIKKKKLSPEEILLKQSEQRRYLTDELLSTEESYVTSLRSLADAYLYPLASDAETFDQDPIVSLEHIKILFGNWSQLLTAQEAFLTALKPTVVPWTDSGSFASVCLGLVTPSSPFYLLEIYKSYASNFDSSRALLAKFEKSVRFQEFNVMARSSESVEHDLAGYLIMPIQRIPRYILLISEIFQNSPSDRKEHEALEKIEKELKELALAVNSARSDADSPPESIPPSPELARFSSDSSILTFQDSFSSLRLTERVTFELPVTHNGVRGIVWLTQRYFCFASKSEKFNFKFSDISNIEIKVKKHKMVITHKESDYKFKAAGEFKESLVHVKENWTKAKHRSVEFNSKIDLANIPPPSPSRESLTSPTSSNPQTPGSKDDLDSGRTSEPTLFVPRLHQRRKSEGGFVSRNELTTDSADSKRMMFASNRAKTPRKESGAITPAESSPPVEEKK